MTAVLQTPAQAGATNCDTGSGHVCLYKNSGYSTGGIARYSGNDRDYSNGILRDNTYSNCYWNCSIQDSISSIKNRGNYSNTRHYKDEEYSGSSKYIARGTDFDFAGHSLNNELSSHQWVS